MADAEEPDAEGLNTVALRGYAAFLSDLADSLCRQAVLNETRCVGAGHFAVEVARCRRLRNAAAQLHERLRELARYVETA